MKKIYDKTGKIFAELNYAKEYYKDYAKHSHETLCLSLIKQGKINVDFHGKKSETLKPKQIVVFNPQEVHMTKNSEVKTYDYYSLHLHIKEYKKLQKDVLQTNELFSIKNIIEDKDLYFELLNCVENFQENEEKTLINIQSIISEILIKYAIKKNSNRQNEEDNSLALQVKEYILQNLHNPISIKDIAKSMSYNEAYINRVFKKAFGLTPHAYLVDKRVQKAKNSMLKNKEINLAALSNEAGFFDQSHFTKAFKKVFAITPNNYKKS